MTKRTFTVSDVAERFGVTERTIHRFIHDGRLPATKIGGSRIMTKADLLTFLDGNEARYNDIFGQDKSPVELQQEQSKMFAAIDRVFKGQGFSAWPADDTHVIVAVPGKLKVKCYLVSSEDILDLPSRIDSLPRRNLTIEEYTRHWIEKTPIFEVQP